MSNAISDVTVKSWLESRKIIMDFLRILCPHMTEREHEHNAAAIIARLAHNDPPLLIGYAEEFGS